MSSNFVLKDNSLLCETGWIDGKPARTASGKQPFQVLDPATREVWAYQESMDVKDTDTAVQHALRAFPEYAAIPSRTRAQMILKLDGLFRENREDFAKLLVMETGKAYAEALGEVDYAGRWKLEPDKVARTDHNSFLYLDDGRRMRKNHW
jgi:succinate-semialdehyde dehydrogenase/glutarate-semialdehyde dehydrogenase